MVGRSGNVSAAAYTRVDGEIAVVIVIPWIIPAIGIAISPTVVAVAIVAMVSV